MSADSKSFRYHLLASAATSLALLVAAPSMAIAQDTDSEDVDEDADLDVIVVEGYRASIENSVALKRDSSSIIEAVSAEDIGKLPDVSIAESLARLPGLTAQRLDGRGQTISVRGLAPDFNTALLNGREQVTTGDNRGVEFDQYPSELLSGAVVYKTPDASLIGQAIGGTIDLRTIRPLSLNEGVVSIGIRGEYNDKGSLNAGVSNKGYRLNGMVADQWANDTFGIALGFSHTDSPNQAERWNAWGYPSTGDVFDPNDPLVLGGAKPYVGSNTLERTSVLGVFEYQPSDTFHSTLDVYYSHFETDYTLRGIELPLWWGGLEPQPGYVTQGGLITEGVFDGVKGVMRNDITTRDADNFAIGWKNEFALTEDWNMTIDVSHSDVSRQDQIIETYSGTGPAGVGATDTLGFRYDPDGGNFIFNSSLDYTDPNLIVLTGPQGWGGGQAGYVNKPTTEDSLNQIRAFVERDIDVAGILSHVEIGYNYASREKSKVNDEYFLRFADGGDQAAIPDRYITGVTDLSFLGIPGMISYDPLGVIASGVYSLDPNNGSDVNFKAWNVGETVHTFYAKFDIDTEFMSIPVLGNVGLQVQSADQSSSAQASDDIDGVGTVVVDVSDGDSYTEFLPSLNLQFDLSNKSFLGDDIFLRFGAARVLARPRMDDMRASQQYGLNETNIFSDVALTQLNSNINSAPFGGSAGNPRLRPWLANQYDVSIEKYFGGAGYVSVAGFIKDLETTIVNQNFEFDFTGFPVVLSDVYQDALDAIGATVDDIYRLGLVSRPSNGSGGTIKGVEVSLSLPVDVVTGGEGGFFDGFGFYGSVSYTDTSIPPINGGQSSTPIPGFSEIVANMTLYYEYEGFNARISDRYRSDFLGEVSGFGADLVNRQVKGEHVIDAQIGYDFRDGWFEGLSLVLQGNNLNNEPFSTFQNDDKRLVVDYQEFGRNFLIGARFRR